MEESELERNIEDGLEENLVYISLLNKDININNDIPMTTVVDSTIVGIEIIKSTIEKLYEQIDFLKDELREKNLLIRILNFRNANDGEKIKIELINENQLSVVETTSTSHGCNCENNSELMDVNIVDYDETSTTISSLTETSDTSQNNSQRYINIVDYDETSATISSLTETSDTRQNNSQRYINIVDYDETSENQLYETVLNSSRIYETIDTQIREHS